MTSPTPWSLGEDAAGSRWITAADGSRVASVSAMADGDAELIVAAVNAAGAPTDPFAYEKVDPMTPDPLREAAQAVADTSPGNYGFIAKWQRLRIVLDEMAQPAPAAPLDRDRLARALCANSGLGTLSWDECDRQDAHRELADAIADAYEEDKP